MRSFRILGESLGFISSLPSFIMLCAKVGYRKTIEVARDPPGGLGYEAKEEENMVPSDKTDIDFVNKLNIRTSGSWPTRSIYSDAEENKILQTAANVEEKATVVQQSARKYDNIKKATWTHMFYDNLKVFFGNRIGELSWIIRDKITDEPIADSAGNILSTRSAIDYALKKMEKDTEQLLRLDFKSKGSMEQDVIDHLSGQTHVARVLQFLKDYRSQMNNKQIAYLHLAHEDNPDVLNYSIVIELT